MITEARVAGLLDPARIRRLLGRRDWHPAVKWQTPADDGRQESYCIDRRDETRRILVSCSPLLPDGDPTPWVHASISTGLLFDRDPSATPTYGDLVLLHQAVFTNGYAYQVFAPPSAHINIRADVLHLWGRYDGKPADLAHLAAAVDEWGSI